MTESLTMLLAGKLSRGYASEEDPVTFSDAEAGVLRFQDQPGAASKEQVQAWRADFRSELPNISRLEQVTFQSVILLKAFTAVSA